MTIIKVYVVIAVTVVSTSLTAAWPIPNPESEHESDEQHDQPFHEVPKSYHYEYAVHDPVTGDDKKHNEVSDGHGTVKGMYSLVEPDGSTRVVEYTADDVHGFVAQVKKIPPLHRRSSSVYNYDLSDSEVQSFPVPVGETEKHLLKELLTSR